MPFSQYAWGWALCTDAADGDKVKCYMRMIAVSGRPVASLSRTYVVSYPRASPSRIDLHVAEVIASPVTLRSTRVAVLLSLF